MYRLMELLLDEDVPINLSRTRYVVLSCQGVNEGKQLLVYLCPLSEGE